MPKNINPIRKAKVKQSLLQGNSIATALRDAGYKPGTIRGNNNSTENKLVNACMAEIMRDLKESDITIEYVLNNLKEDRELAKSKGDYATATRCDELYGKFLAMFTDKVQLKVANLSEADRIEYLARIRNRLLTVTT